MTNQALINQLESTRDNVTLYRIMFTTGKKPYLKADGGLTDNRQEAGLFTMRQGIDAHAKFHPKKIASFCEVKSSKGGTI